MGRPAEPQHLLVGSSLQPLAEAAAGEAHAKAGVGVQAEVGLQAGVQAEACALLPPSMYTWWPTSAPLAHEELGRPLPANPNPHPNPNPNPIPNPNPTQPQP